ncbi:MAG: DUF4235 domain-containing protein [Micrococcales bacterium]|nr:DUF4235 domain-containing protein [Micrococcales bacterium]MCL2668532.1 DUF4235 domain-containing protein [Micrococcales bacterium]
MADTQSDTRVVKVAGALAAVGAAAIAQKLISAAWKAARGRKPPTVDDVDEGAGMVEVVVAAAVTGALVAVVRVLATRSAVHATRQAIARSAAAADDSVA